MFVLELGDDHVVGFHTTLHHLLEPENFMFDFLQPGHDIPLLLRASNIISHQDSVNLAHLLGVPLHFCRVRVNTLLEGFTLRNSGGGHDGSKC